MFSEMSLARGYLVNCFKFKVDSIKYLFMISSVMQEIYSIQKIATSMAFMSYI